MRSAAFTRQGQLQRGSNESAPLAHHHVHVSINDGSIPAIIQEKTLYMPVYGVGGQVVNVQAPQEFSLRHRRIEVILAKQTPCYHKVAAELSYQQADS